MGYIIRTKRLWDRADLGLVDYFRVWFLHQIWLCTCSADKIPSRWKCCMICDRKHETCHTAWKAFAFRRASELYFDASENCFIVELVENRTHVQCTTHARVRLLRIFRADERTRPCSALSLQIKSRLNPLIPRIYQTDKEYSIGSAKALRRSRWAVFLEGPRTGIGIEPSAGFGGTGKLFPTDQLRR